MILDKNGEQIEPKKPSHRFGMFNIPENCHIKNFDSITDVNRNWYGVAGSRRIKNPPVDHSGGSGEKLDRCE